MLLVKPAFLGTVYRWRVKAAGYRRSSSSSSIGAIALLWIVPCVAATLPQEADDDGGVGQSDPLLLSRYNITDVC